MTKNVIVELIKTEITRIYQERNMFVRPDDISVYHIYHDDVSKITAPGESFTIEIRTDFIGYNIIQSITDVLKAKDVLFSFEVKSNRKHYSDSDDHVIFWILKAIF